MEGKDTIWEPLIKI